MILLPTPICTTLCAYLPTIPIHLEMPASKLYTTPLFATSVIVNPPPACFSMREGGGWVGVAVWRQFDAETVIHTATDDQYIVSGLQHLPTI